MGGYCNNQDEDGVWPHDNVDGCGEKLSDYGCILNMEPKGFSDRLDVGLRRVPNCCPMEGQPT